MNGTKTPANPKALERIKAEITKDICEIVPGKWDRDDNTDRLVLTIQHLDLILRRHLLGEDV